MQNNIQKAIKQIQQGGMVIVTDSHDRENEGDLIMAAEFITPEKMNFIIKNTGGVVCLSLSSELTEKFNLPMMTQHNEAAWQTPFTISIDARAGITTGISAADRSHTIRLAADDNTTAQDFVSPGHVFPLKASSYGILQREGHTEAAVDLMKLAGLKQAAIISELMNEDGSMMRNKDLLAFASQWSLPILSIEELKHYRLQHDMVLQLAASTRLPTHAFSELHCDIFYNPARQEEYVVLRTQAIADNCLVRIHSSCFTGDILGSQRCDCGWQLHEALSQIQQQSGLVIYLSQEGRGIGLLNKIRAYSLQDQGHNTVSANHELGFQADLRNYDFCGQILRYYQITQIQLMTNNPAKMHAIANQGITATRIPLITRANNNNYQYLQTKAELLNHLLN